LQNVIDDLSRSPVHPVNVKANSRAMILIRTVYPNSEFLSDSSIEPVITEAANVRCFLTDRSRAMSRRAPP